MEEERIGNAGKDSPSDGNDIASASDAGAEKVDPTSRQPRAKAQPDTIDALLAAIIGTDVASATPSAASDGRSSVAEPAQKITEDHRRAALRELIASVRQKVLSRTPSAARKAEISKWQETCSSDLEPHHPPETCMFLKVTVVEARALVGELVDERTKDVAQRSFVVDLQFNGQRARTSNDVPCCVEPNFGDESFAFILRDGRDLPVTAGAWASLLQTDLPLHLALVTQTKSQRGQTFVAVNEPSDVVLGASLSSEGAARRALVGTAEIDWRRALVSPSGDDSTVCERSGVLLAVELASSSPDSIVHPVGGILHIRLEVIAPQSLSPFPFTAADVKRVMDLQVSVLSEQRRDFYLYAEAWWRNFTSGSGRLHKRSVKIFSEDERGQHRCVCSFLHPQRRGRLLPTPRHAARFVALLPFQRRPSVGDRAVQTWKSPHAFLSAGRGDAADHALLLCSLLLGFGLDALVCVGTVEHDVEAEAIEKYEDSAGETGHLWVCTFCGRRQDGKVFFWEALTGQRFGMTRSADCQRTRPRSSATKVTGSTSHHFRRISCMFSHREFFANKQADDAVARTSLNISDAKLWKAMDPSRITTAGTGCASSSSDGRNNSGAIVLLRSTIEAEASAIRVEAGIKQRVTRWREENALSTVWDDDLAFLLGPAMFAYEQERLSGVSFGDSDFQDSIHGAVPDGHCFKGFPTCFDHCSSRRMMAFLLADAMSRDIIKSTGDHLRLSVRSMVFPYPDGVAAVWLMLACRFEPLGGVQ